MVSQRHQSVTVSDRDQPTASAKTFNGEVSHVLDDLVLDARIAAVM
jgi:hypothetical protein